MIRQIAHLCFFSDQPEALVRFYTEALGLKTVFHLRNKEGQVFGHYLGAGQSTFLEIFDQALAKRQWGGTPAPLQAGTRFQHFCLEVTDLEAFARALGTRGVAVTEPKRGMDGSLQAWVTDPDGNRIELMQYTGASSQLTGADAV